MTLPAMVWRTGYEPNACVLPPPPPFALRVMLLGLIKPRGLLRKQAFDPSSQAKSKSMETESRSAPHT